MWEWQRVPVKRIAVPDGPNVYYAHEEGEVSGGILLTGAVEKAGKDVGIEKKLS